MTEINGKPTAKIMFFNGTSQTPDGPIEYLPNPNREANLAFSFQMQQGCGNVSGIYEERSISRDCGITSTSGRARPSLRWAPRRTRMKKRECHGALAHILDQVLREAESVDPFFPAAKEIKRGGEERAHHPAQGIARSPPRPGVDELCDNEQVDLPEQHIGKRA